MSATSEVEIRSNIAYELAKGDKELQQEFLAGHIKNIAILKGDFEDKAKNRRVFFALVAKKNPASVLDVVSIVVFSSSSVELEPVVGWKSYFRFLYDEYGKGNSNPKEAVILNAILSKIPAAKLQVLVTNAMRGDSSRLKRELTDTLHSYTGSSDIGLDLHLEILGEVDYLYTMRKIEAEEKIRLHEKRKEEKEEEAEEAKVQNDIKESEGAWRQRYSDFSFVDGTPLISSVGSPVGKFATGDKLYVKLDPLDPAQLEILKAMDAYDEEKQKVSKVVVTILENQKQAGDYYNIIGKFFKDRGVRIKVEGGYNLLASPVPPKSIVIEERQKSAQFRLRMIMIFSGVALLGILALGAFLVF